MLCWQGIPGSICLAPRLPDWPAARWSIRMQRSSVLKWYAADSREKTGRHVLSRLFHTLELWLSRRQGRRELGSLDDRQLKDVGISREAVLREARKPFWRD
jgi:uncharacterized protein YjiS (DUF1127 family)